MQLTNTETRYGIISKLFHWCIFVLVIFMLILGALFDVIPKADKHFYVNLHKSFGLLILLIMLLWIIWTVFNAKPKFPKTMPGWEKLSAIIIHHLLYISIFIMPIIGWVMSSAANKAPNFFWLGKARLPILPNKHVASFFADLHNIFAWIICGLIIIHVLAAFKHLLIDKDIVMQRMLPWKSKRLIE